MLLSVSLFGSFIFVQMVQFFDWKFIKEEDLQILELDDNDIEVKK
jgi:hypothetical protein